jgi:uncharacterized surface protein with fasciclin (FAS1) repeats
LISLALFTLRLPAGFLTGRPLTIFVPNDEAIGSLPPGDFDRLIEHEGRRNLLGAMLDHVAAEEHAAADAWQTEYRSVNGTRISVQSGAGQPRADRPASVLKELRAGPHRIYIIDRVLNAGAAMPRARRY